MVFDIYKIRSREIAAFVPYILFNRCLDPHYSATITSFANTNICLGIIQGKSLESTGEGIKFTRDRNGISSYLSGMYLSPHRFTASGTLDEICIDFTPLGYYQFLKLPARTYILNEDILSEAFGKEAISFFERVFAEDDLQRRGSLIEEFLVSHYRQAESLFLKQILDLIHQRKGNITLKELAFQMHCSEKKIVRRFSAHFDLTPKDYIRIVRFRRSMGLMMSGHPLALTAVCYESEYYDQSHFIKEVRFFTGDIPGNLRKNIRDVKGEVIIGID